MERIFVDSDIILDLLAKRPTFYQHAAALFSLAERRKINIYISPIIVANIHYILCRLKDKEFAMQSLRKLKLLVHILPVDEKIIELAMASDFKDFEDAIQYYVAKANGIDCLLSRNKKDYREANYKRINSRRVFGRPWVLK